MAIFLVQLAADWLARRPSLLVGATAIVAAAVIGIARASVRSDWPPFLATRLSVSSVVPLIGDVHDENRAYLETKRDKMGHALPADLAPPREDG